MKTIQFITIIFILWEVIQECYAPFFWNKILNDWNKQKPNKISFSNKLDLLLNIMSWSFIIYVIYLLFTQWWYVSVFIVLIEIIISIITIPYIKENTPINSKIRMIGLIDSLITIFLLSKILW